MLFAAVVAVWGTVAFVGQYARTYALARQAAQLDQRHRTLTAQNEQLREEIQRLETDDAYIEHLARTELGLVRPGEVEFMLVPSPSGPGQTPAGPGPSGGPGAASPDGGAAGQGAAAPPDQPTASAHTGWLDRLIARVSSLLARFHR